MRTRSIRSYIYLTAGLGLIASIYTALETLDAGLRGSCTVNSYFSCSAVDTSGRTTTLGIPDAAIGIAGFVLILVVAALAERHGKDIRYLYALLFFTTVGVAFASYFAYVELVQIHALCPVCTAAYAFGVLVWVGGIALTRRVRNRLRKAQAVPTPAHPESAA
jgi:uncharacterized membrane protein